MKYFKFLIIAVSLFCLAACSGGSTSYSPEKCEQLKEKIKDKQPLTEADYDEMIGQMSGMAKYFTKEQEAIGEDKEKMKEFANSEEGKKLFGYVLEFGFYLDAHKDELSKSNIQKLSKVQEEFKKID